MKLGLKMILVMVGVALASAALLGLIYSVTAPVIAENNELSRQEALDSLLPTADRFEPDTIIEGADTSVIYHGYSDEMNMKVGMVFTVAPKGYAGPIKIMVAVNPDSTVAAIRIAGPDEGFKETPGLGSKVREDWFIDQFNGLMIEELYLAKDGGRIDAVTAATISSDGVTSGIRYGMEKFLPYLKLEPGSEENTQTDGAGEETDASEPTAQTEPELNRKEVTAQGWNGDFRVVVFLDAEGRIAKIDIPAEDFNEDQGWGTDCCEPGFLSEFTGLSTAEEVMAVDAVTKATTTLRGFKNAVASVLP